MISMKPLIGISCEIKPPEVRRSFSAKKVILVLNEEYPRAVEQAGGYPVIIPVFEQIESIKGFMQQLNGLILSGGSDVVMLGEAWKGDPICPKRSDHEMSLIAAAREANIPILGICRGIQQINVFFGGTLWDDLPAWKSGAVDHRRGKRDRKFRHPLRLDGTSPLTEILRGDSLEVNSYHHQAIKKLGEGLRIVARAEDDVIEAVESLQEPLLWAVQWHPERLGQHPAGSGLLERFVTVCGQHELRTS